jgi:DNA polymerase-3 subunit gamma/tau
MTPPPGVEWEALLVEMQSLLHRIAMVQLSPSALGADMAAVEVRMRELARTVPPATFSSTTKRC